MVTKIKPKDNSVKASNILVFTTFLLLIALMWVIMLYTNQENMMLILVGVFVGFLIIFIIIYIYTVKDIKYTTYFIEDKFITKENRFFSYTDVDIPFENITNIEYNIGWLFDKYYGLGSISIFTSGTGGADLILKDVKNPKELYEKVNEKVNEYRIGNKKEVSQSIKLDNNSTIESKTQNKPEKIVLERTIKPNVNIAALYRTFTVGVIIALVSIQFVSIIIRSVLGGFLTFITILTIVYFIAKELYKRITYNFYSDRLEYSESFFSKNKKTVYYERITDIDSKQSLTDRILGVSIISIQTAGSGGSEISIDYIKEGETIVQELNKILKKRGVE